MKKSILPPAVLLAVIIYSPVLPAENPSPPPAPIVLTVSAADAVPFNPLLLGVNVNFTKRPYDYSESRVMDITRPLHLTMFRYPAGGEANWWDWKTGSAMPQETINRRVPAGHHRDTQPVSIRQALGKWHGGALTVDGFAAFCRDLDATPIWVANLHSGAPEESAAWVASNREKKIHNTFWELGNEAYLRVMRDRYPTAAVYAQEAREHAAAMKKSDPSIRVAIIGTSDRFSPGRKNRGGDGVWIEESDDTAWNNVIARDKFYDAVTVHDYMVTNKEIIGLDAGAMHRYLMARNPLTLPGFVAYFQKTFGAGMKLWFTEWNIIPYLDKELAGKNNPKDGAPAERIDTSLYWHTKSQSHALYVADWLLQSARFPETVECAHLHVLAAPFFWGLYQLDAPEDKNLKEPFRKNPPYYAVQLIGEAARGAEKFQFINTGAGPQMRGAVKFNGKTFPQLVAGAFFAGDRARAVIVINKGGDPVRVTLGAAAVAEIAAAWDTEPIAGWGQHKDGSEYNYRQDVRFERAAGGSSSEITLHPYSITKIQFAD
jgi:hypothetical protein